MFSNSPQIRLWKHGILLLEEILSLMKVAGKFQAILGERRLLRLSEDKSEILSKERVPVLTHEFENHRVGQVLHITDEEAGCLETRWAWTHSHS